MVPIFTVPFYWGMLEMMITKGAVTVSYTAMYTYTSELFPTVIRNTAVGCCSTIARVGAIMSSYMALWLVRNSFSTRTEEGSRKRRCHDGAT